MHGREACDPVNGCSTDGTGITIACNDDNACTTGETCQGDAAGTCGGGITVTCIDDGNTCTVRKVVTPSMGVRAMAPALPSPVMMTMPVQTEKPVRVMKAGTCGVCHTSLNCDDENPCTSDTCDALKAA